MVPRTWLLGYFLCASVAWAQGIITTVAGTDFAFPRGPMAATAAPLGAVSGVATDADGNVYIADASNSLVLKLDLAGMLTVVAGNGAAGFSGDGGPATSAALNFPRGLAIDGAHNLFIADSNNHRVRKVSQSGTITTFAGDGHPQFTGDGGSATSASLRVPSAVAVNAAGEVFIADSGSSRIRKISVDGVITTVAGNGRNYIGPEDGVAATETALLNPTGVAVDSKGDLYIADDWPVRKVCPNGVITAIPLPPGQFCSATTTAVAVDTADNLFAMTACGQVLEVSPPGTIRLLAGTGMIGFGGDGGFGASAVLMKPAAVAVDGDGNVFIADTGNGRIRRVIPTGFISTVAGNGQYRFGGDGADARSAYLNFPRGIAVTGTGDLYIADTFNNRVRRVSANGAIATVAGTGAFSFAGDGGLAIDATLALPYGVAVNSAGTVFIADAVNSRIRKVDAAGVINTVLGGATAVAVDASDNLFATDIDHAYKLTPSGVLSRIAGSLNPESGFSGDGGPAIDAQLSGLFGIAADTEGNVYLAVNDRIRTVGVDGIITTFAGGGDGEFSGDGGPAIAASLSSPSGVAIDKRGNVYIADSGNHCIRMVTAAGIISTIAGTGEAGFSGDGASSTAARLNTPTGIALDASGNLYVADAGNHRIRKIVLAQ
jgi:sugar lactone lactonase YvrE